MRFNGCLILLFNFSFFISGSFAQDMPYAHFVVNTLTSKEFAGRGYVNDGNNKAARFIQQQFDSLRLGFFTQSYSQPFSFPVNTFPEKMEVKIDSKKLVPGDDYIVYHFSSGAEGSVFKLKKLKKIYFPGCLQQTPGNLLHRISR